MRKKNDGQMGGRSALPVPCMSLLDTKQPMPPADRHKFAVVGWVRASPGIGAATMYIHEYPTVTPNAAGEALMI